MAKGGRAEPPAGKPEEAEGLLDGSSAQAAEQTAEDEPPRRAEALWPGTGAADPKRRPKPKRET
jgi:hypothetical protein